MHSPFLYFLLSVENQAIVLYFAEAQEADSLKNKKLVKKQEETDKCLDSRYYLMNVGMELPNEEDKEPKNSLDMNLLNQQDKELPTEWDTEQTHSQDTEHLNEQDMELMNQQGMADQMNIVKGKRSDLLGMEENRYLDRKVRMMEDKMGLFVD